MTKVGITGHRVIPEAALDYVAGRIESFLARQAAPLVGYSSLAAGADQLFAQLVLRAGGELVAVIPCDGYESTFCPDTLRVYQELVARAGQVTTLEFPQPGDPAYIAASHVVVSMSDVVVAVWDGGPANRRGGTADTVWAAWRRGIPVLNAWPQAARR
ncbi:MAG: hypothetical protein LBD51_02985 [Bifidobacteriaceae bacterium]|jgi:hypothetical protein|nr:hypothetical protein [Bifidobacteriaceae bacterium]